MQVVGPGMDERVTMPQQASAQLGLAEARRMAGRVECAAGIAGVARDALPVLVAAGAVDVMVPVPVWLRAVAMAIVCGWLLVRCAWAARETFGCGMDSARLADRLDRIDTEVADAFRNAVSFSEARPCSDVLTGELARCEVERAESLARSLPARAGADSRTLARRVRQAGIAAIVATFTCLLFPRAARFEAPRLLGFWTDPPPYSRTDFDVRPGSVRAAVGGDVRICVTVSGDVPRSVWLRVREPGQAESVAPMAPTDPNTYEQSLRVPRGDVEYCAASETGRSRWFRISALGLPRVIAVRAGAAGALKPVSRGGDVAVSAGTSLAVEVSTDQPIAGARLRTDGGSASDLSCVVFPARGASVVGSIVVTRNASVHVDLLGSAGGEAPDAFVFQVKTLPTPPRVQIAEPGDALVAAGGRAAVTVVATPPVPGCSVSIRARSLIVAARADGPGVYRGMLDVAQIGARPGDSVPYDAIVTQGPSGLVGARSTPCVLRVVSAKEALRVSRLALLDARVTTERFRALAVGASELAVRPGRVHARQRAHELQREAGRLRADLPGQGAMGALRRRASDVSKALGVVDGGRMPSASHARMAAALASGAAQASDVLARLGDLHAALGEVTSGARSQRALARAMAAVPAPASKRADPHLAMRQAAVMTRVSAARNGIARSLTFAPISNVATATSVARVVNELSQTRPWAAMQVAQRSVASEGPASAMASAAEAAAGLERVATLADVAKAAIAVEAGRRVRAALGARGVVAAGDLRASAPRVATADHRWVRPVAMGAGDVSGSGVAVASGAGVEASAPTAGLEALTGAGAERSAGMPRRRDPVRSVPEDATPPAYRGLVQEYFRAVHGREGRR